jgi:hypothetical protein
VAWAESLRRRPPVGLPLTRVLARGWCLPASRAYRLILLREANLCFATGLAAVSLASGATFAVLCYLAASPERRYGQHERDKGES